MANITASDVNKLRQMTGVGMMDCKKALQECDGDFEKAVDYLRQKGQKLAAKRADREANEGVVLAKTTGKLGAAIMVSCETDFVAKNEDFISFTRSILDSALANGLKSVDQVLEMDMNGRKVADLIIDQVGKIGEKIELAHYESVEAETVYAYIHPGNRLATVVGFSKAGHDEVGKEIAMQIAAMAPVALDQSSVSADVIERELDVYRAQVREEGKPENMVEQIATGKLNKFFKESTLLNQDFIKDSKKSVKQYLSEVDKDLTITAFKRVALGS